MPKFAVVVVIVAVVVVVVVVVIVVVVVVVVVVIVVHAVCVYVTLRYISVDICCFQSKLCGVGTVVELRYLFVVDF